MSTSTLRVVPSNPDDFTPDLTRRNSKNEWPKMIGLAKLRFRLQELLDDEDFDRMPGVLKQINYEYYCNYTGEKANHREAILQLLDEITRDIIPGEHPSVEEQMHHLQGTITHFDPYLPKESQDI